MWKAIVTAALLAQYANAQAMLRFACSQLVVERTDPIVNPGAIYTPHLHQIVGGNSFNITMDPTSHDLPSQSTCTSCSFKEDLSNYWTAVLMYRSGDGKFMRVPTTGNGGPQGKLEHPTSGPGKGGMDIYYIPNPARGKQVAFKKGFRMIAGDAGNKDASKVKKNMLCHRCWTSPNESQFVGGAPCTGSDTVEIPTSKTCQMIRQTLIFPTCWDGKNLDSPNHQDHMAYSGGYGGANGGGSCPSTHPIPTPQIMYEIMWNVTEFTKRSDFGSNPYTLSMGLGGSAIHGDYVFGWKDDTLQKAMDNGCNLNRDCAAAGIHFQQPSEYSKCTIAQQAPENVDGFLDQLPVSGMITK
jgi:hypothetical protein